MIARSTARVEHQQQAAGEREQSFSEVDRSVDRDDFSRLSRTLRCRQQSQPIGAAARLEAARRRAYSMKPFCSMSKLSR